MSIPKEPVLPPKSAGPAAALVNAFISDIGPMTEHTLVAYKAAVAGIAYSHKWGRVYDPLGYRGAGILPQHSQVLRERTNAQNLLRVLVPAQRYARRLYQQLLFQPGHADLSALEEHLLSHAYQTPRALLFSDNTAISRKERCNNLAHRHTWRTLTREQAAFARNLLARHTELFTWGPKFATAYPNIPISSTSA